MGDVLAFRRPEPADQAVAPLGEADREPAVTPTAPPGRSGWERDPAPDRPEVEPLWRQMAGAELRAARLRRRQTLAQVAARAGVSVQYLSEIERGRKEPSSEVLAAVTGALELTLLDLTAGVARQLLPRRLDAGPAGRNPGPVALAA